MRHWMRDAVDGMPRFSAGETVLTEQKDGTKILGVVLGVFWQGQARKWKYVLKTGHDVYEEMDEGWPEPLPGIPAPEG